MQASLPLCLFLPSPHCQVHIKSLRIVQRPFSVWDLDQAWVDLVHNQSELDWGPIRIPKSDPE